MDFAVGVISSRRTRAPDRNGESRGAVENFSEKFANASVLALSVKTHRRMIKVESSQTLRGSDCDGPGLYLWDVSLRKDSAFTGSGRCGSSRRIQPDES